MTRDASWPSQAIRYLAPILLLLLVAEYFLGLWVNLYAPAPGFTSSTQLPALIGHYDIGYLLGLLALVAVIFTALSRHVPHIVLAVLVLVGVAVAGIAGGDFVRTSPNPSGASLLMGAMFLVALIGALGLTAMTWMPMRAAPPSPMAPASN